MLTHFNLGSSCVGRQINFLLKKCLSLVLHFKHVSAFDWLYIVKGQSIYIIGLELGTTKIKKPLVGPKIQRVVNLGSH
jgi:hypothetical protein